MKVLTPVTVVIDVYAAEYLEDLKDYLKRHNLVPRKLIAIKLPLPAQYYQLPSFSQIAASYSADNVLQWAMNQWQLTEKDCCVENKSLRRILKHRQEKSSPEHIVFLEEDKIIDLPLTRPVAVKQQGFLSFIKMLLHPKTMKLLPRAKVSHF